MSTTIIFILIGIFIVLPLISILFYFLVIVPLFLNTFNKQVKKMNEQFDEDSSKMWGKRL